MSNQEDGADFYAAFEKFLSMVRVNVITYYTTSFPSLEPPVITYKEGRRYIKLISSTDGINARRVYCFIDKTNGDILKAATWKAPAKHARGSIYDADHGASSVNHYGANYLK